MSWAGSPLPAGGKARLLLSVPGVSLEHHDWQRVSG